MRTSISRAEKTWLGLILLICFIVPALAFFNAQQTATLAPTLEIQTRGDGAVWSPDGSEILVYSVNQGAVGFEFFDAKTGLLRRAFPQKSSENWARFSRDGKRFLTVGFAWGKTTYSLRDVQTGRTLKRSIIQGKTVVLSPNEKHAVLLSDNPDKKGFFSLQLQDFWENKVLGQAQIRKKPAMLGESKFCANGSLFFVNSSETAKIFRVSNERWKEIPLPKVFSFVMPLQKPNRFLGLRKTGGFSVVDLDSGETNQRAEWEPRIIPKRFPYMKNGEILLGRQIYSPDGKFYRGDLPSGDIWAVDENGRYLSYKLRFRNSGTPHALEIFDFVRRENIARLPLTQSEFWMPPEWSNDGRRVALISERGQLRIFDLPKRK